MTLGENIKSYRKKLNLSQEELGLKSGLSRNAIYNYEKGKRQPNIEAITRIAKELNVSLSALINGDDPFSKDLLRYVLVAYKKNTNNLINVENLIVILSNECNISCAKLSEIIYEDSNLNANEIEAVFSYIKKLDEDTYNNFYNSYETNRLKILGNRITIQRERNNFTKDKLAELSGLELSFIERLEKGYVSTQPPYDVLNKIVNVLNINLSTLICDDNNTIGGLIRQSREIRKITQKQLAEHLNDSEEMIEKYESGEVPPRLEKLTAISKFFKISISDLIPAENKFTLDILGAIQTAYYNKYKIPAHIHTLVEALRDDCNIPDEIASDIVYYLAEIDTSTKTILLDYLNTLDKDVFQEFYNILENKDLLLPNDPYRLQIKERLPKIEILEKIIGQLGFKYHANGSKSLSADYKYLLKNKDVSFDELVEACYISDENKTVALSEEDMISLCNKIYRYAEFEINELISSKEDSK